LGQLALQVLEPMAEQAEQQAQLWSATQILPGLRLVHAPVLFHKGF
jgi:hypothetical protein